jgi:hypothetical protein
MTHAFVCVFVIREKMGFPRLLGDPYGCPRQVVKKDLEILSKGRSDVVVGCSKRW